MKTMIAICVAIGIAWFSFLVFLLRDSTRPFVVDCTNAPPQYRGAGEWIDAGTRVRCAKDGEKGVKHNLFYSDSIIP
jgi:hypothetical protein